LTDSGLSLVLDHVELSRGERRLVSDLSFVLRPGQLALITGPNGSGKTTLLRTLAGLSPPAGGVIRFCGRRLEELEPDQRGDIAYHGHLDGLKKDLTIEENILFFSELRSFSSAFYETLQQLGLRDFRSRSVRHLSAGQKRRTALAVLRLSGAKLWLLDEPLTNLDASGRHLVMAWLDEHLAAGGAAVVATHLSEELTRPGCLLVEL
jgi:heme exporter protein A